MSKLPNVLELKAQGDMAGLVAALSHFDEWVAAGAATALGELGDVSAVPALIDATKDSRRLIVLAAVEALGEIGNPLAKDRLNELMHQAFPSTDPGPGTHPHPAPLDAVFREMKTQQGEDIADDIREAARDALEKLGTS